MDDHPSMWEFRHADHTVGNKHPATAQEPTRRDRVLVVPADCNPGSPPGSRAPSSGRRAAVERGTPSWAQSAGQDRTQPACTTLVYIRGHVPYPSPHHRPYTPTARATSESTLVPRLTTSPSTPPSPASTARTAQTHSASPPARSPPPSTTPTRAPPPPPPTRTPAPTPPHTHLP